MTVGLIKTGFQKCDIFSLDRNAIDTNSFSENSQNPSALSSNSSNRNRCTDTFQEVNNTSTSTSTAEYRVFQIALRDGGVRNFLLGGGGGVNQVVGTKLKIAFCEFWTSIKMKISMTCAYKESEIKTKMIYTGAIATSKNEVVFGL